jgi:hypothetical protein
MNYATWKLDFTDPNYGTGPEAKIDELGFAAEATGWVTGEVEDGAIILGYVTEPQDESELALWDYANITEAEALSFCQTINPLAILQTDGRISAPSES